MYRAIVARRVRTTWEHLARGDYAYVLRQLAPACKHSFAGDHALGGERSSRDAPAGVVRATVPTPPRDRVHGRRRARSRGWP